MYEQHFGLKKRPFRASATGSDVFVGPQTAATMAALKKALDVSDAIVTVSGEVGVGKTTLVNRALNALGKNRVIISVGRIQLDNDEVLELLLDELGTRQTPAGTVQRFSLFRRLLKGFSDKGTRVFFVVEDAARIGLDALSELEALTAADAGVSDGANIVLMGEPGINQQMKAPQLARMKQRIRLRESIKPLCASELLAYLKHCFRLAGVDYDSIFAAGTAERLQQLSDGIPRVVNNIVESTLGSAAEQKLDCISAEFITSVVEDECGMTGQLKTLGSAPLDAAEAEIASDPAPEPAVATAAADTSRSKAKPVTPVNDEGADPIPELIQDTLPNLAVLSPEPATMPAPAAVPADLPKPVVDKDVESTPKRSSDADIPTLSNSMRLEHPVGGRPATDVPVVDGEAKREPVAMPPVARAKTTPAPVAPAGKNEIPDYERDPTLAQLRPDLDALERAMALTQDDSAEPEPEPIEVSAAVAKDSSAVPEITLDRAIQEKIDEAAELLKKSTTDLAEIAAAEDAKKAAAGARPATSKATPAAPASTKHKEAETGKPDAELQEISTGLAKAKTIDDVDDKMAETLFGEEFSQIAAQVAAHVAANSPPDESANDDSPLDGEAAAAPDPVAESNSEAKIEPVARPGKDDKDHTFSASQRLRTVRALNSNYDPVPEPEKAVLLADDRATYSAPMTGEQPESIEDQINTSMTQTLKALNVRPPSTVVDDDDDDDDDDDGGGFFSRFRRT